MSDKIAASWAVKIVAHPAAEPPALPPDPDVDVPTNGELESMLELYLESRFPTLQISVTAERTDI